MKKGRNLLFFGQEIGALVGAPIGAPRAGKPNPDKICLVAASPRRDLCLNAFPVGKGTQTFWHHSLAADGVAHGLIEFSAVRKWKWNRDDVMAGNLETGTADTQYCSRLYFLHHLVKRQNVL